MRVMWRMRSISLWKLKFWVENGSWKKKRPNDGLYQVETSTLAELHRVVVCECILWNKVLYS